MTAAEAIRILFIFMLGWMCGYLWYKEITSAVPRRTIGLWFDRRKDTHLTIPRLVLQNMPLQWQYNFVALLSELDATFKWRPTRGRYVVQIRDGQGHFHSCGLVDYRNGKADHLRK